MYAFSYSTITTTKRLLNLLLKLGKKLPKNITKKLNFEIPQKNPLDDLEVCMNMMYFNYY